MSKIIAITLGDPAGIGPEVTFKALVSKKLPKDVHFQVIGSKTIRKPSG